MVRGAEYKPGQAIGRGRGTPRVGVSGKNSTVPQKVHVPGASIVNVAKGVAKCTIRAPRGRGRPLNMTISPKGGL